MFKKLIIACLIVIATAGSVHAQDDSGSNADPSTDTSNAVDIGTNDSNSSTTIIYNDEINVIPTEYLVPTQTCNYYYSATPIVCVNGFVPFGVRYHNSACYYRYRRVLPGVRPQPIYLHRGPAHHRHHP